MKCNEIIKLVEEIAPIEYAQEWDNVGLLIGDAEKNVHKIMIALDVTTDVIEQAIHEKIDLLITHHPMIFSPLKKITSNDFIGRKVISLIQHNISYYAMHTNFDATILAELGAKKMELQNVTILEVDKLHEQVGIGRMGYLNTPITLHECGELVKIRLGLKHVSLIGEEDKLISYIAISPGSGKSMINASVQAGVDVLITGDIDHHNGIDAKEQGLCIIDAGHYGTEHIMVDYVKEYLNQHLSIDIIKAKETDPFIII